MDSVDPCSRPRHEAFNENVLKRPAAQIDHGKFTIVDYTDVFCGARWHASVGGILAYRGSRHDPIPLTRSFGTQALRPEFESVIASEDGKEWGTPASCQLILASACGAGPSPSCAAILSLSEALRMGVRRTIAVGRRPGLSLRTSRQRPTPATAMMKCNFAY